MLPGLVYRTLRSTPPRLLWKFAWNFGVKNLVGIERFKRRLKRGEAFPAFVQFSIINSCNLSCQGCWVDVDAPRELLEAETVSRAISEARGQGNYFFGLLGGEPFMHPDLLKIPAAHPDCYFQVFTNGQMLTENAAAEMRRLGNVSPLISIEGTEWVSDERRGGKGVWERSMRGLEHSVKAGLLTGVATSLCRSNIEDLLSESWLRELIARGVHYVWYYTYRPVGPRPNYDLALGVEDQLRARRFIVDMRCRLPLAILETYYDHAGRALCPMATGISHHVSPRGEIEPCPVIQFATDNIRDAGGIVQVMKRSAFLKDFRDTARAATRGCIVLERPDLIQELVKRHGARDTTSRGTALAEVLAMQPARSQWLPGQEIPEKHWMYRLAKRYWFNSFGAYGNRGTVDGGRITVTR